MLAKGGPGARVATAHGWRSGGRTSQACLAGATWIWPAPLAGLYEPTVEGLAL